MGNTANNHGSLLSFSVEGISFGVPKGTKIQLSNNDYEVELESNGPSEASVKYTGKEKVMDGVELSVSLVEYEMLVDWANDIANTVGISAQLIDKTTIKGQCKLSLGTWDSGDGKVSLKALAPTRFTIISA